MAASETPAAPTVAAAVTHPLTPQNVSLVLKEFISEEPALVAEFNSLAPYAAVLPAPFNAIANPVVLKAVNLLPKLLPILTRVQAVLDSIAVPANPA